MKIVDEQMAKMTDEEIVAMIVSGRRILQKRFDARKKTLESEYAQQIKKTEAKARKTRKGRVNAVSQAA
jgi:hypothetical protein